MKLRIGVSSCLLGEKVRFDGNHRLDAYIRDILGPFVEWVPICPEVDVGMGVPRESVELWGNVKKPKMVGHRSGKDWTAKMNRYSSKKTLELKKSQLSGYLFKKRSPSCGISGVAVYQQKNKTPHFGMGLFASAFKKRFPLIPVEDEGRLQDPKIREKFITRVFSFYRLQQLMQNYSRKALVKFHTLHKFTIMAHNEKLMRELGRLVASVDKKPEAALKKQYSKLFMEALDTNATVKKHTNVLQHMAGYLKDKATSEEIKDLHRLIEDYHHKYVPLVVPITLLGHLVRKYKIDYLQDQVYLYPHPKELMLLNHV